MWLYRTLRAMWQCELQDFPGGSVVKNPPASAGDMGSIPGLGTKIPHDTGQLNLCATTMEARALEPTSCKKRSPHNEKPRHHEEE